MRRGTWEALWNHPIGGVQQRVLSFNIQPNTHKLRIHYESNFKGGADQISKDFYERMAPWFDFEQSLVPNTWNSIKVSQRFFPISGDQVAMPDARVSQEYEKFLVLKGEKSHPYLNGLWKFAGYEYYRPVYKHSNHPAYLAANAKGKWEINWEPNRGQSNTYSALKQRNRSLLN